MSDLTPMQAAFCAAYAEFGNAARAARIAGYSPTAARQLGSRLLGRPKIVHRIAELRAAIAERDAQDAPTLLAKLEAIYREALDANQFHAAARAVDLQARLRGLYPGSGHGDGDGETAAPEVVDINDHRQFKNVEKSVA